MNLVQALDIYKLDPKKSNKTYSGNEFITFLCLNPGIHKVKVSVYLFFLENETDSHINFYFNNDCNFDSQNNQLSVKIHEYCTHHNIDKNNSVIQQGKIVLSNFTSNEAEPIIIFK